ncbi:MAG: hypothetical protein RIA69_05530 [Cyclobacteriaceae bacterium]
MLFFLRKIRRKLISTDNKIVSYLLYAIGEIFLVVVGIMIAVQLDNWNEQRKDNEKLENYLKLVQLDLKKDIENIRLLKDYYFEKDSLLDVILFDSIPKDSLRKERYQKVTRVFNSLTSFEPSREGYEKLTLLGDLASRKHPEVYDNLTFQYNNRANILNKSIQSTRQVFWDYRENIKNKEWYADYMMLSFRGSKVPPSYFIDYFYSDPQSRNNISRYHYNIVKVALRLTVDYEYLAMHNYREVTAALGQDTIPDEFVLRLPTSLEVEQLTGTFAFRDLDLISFTQNDNKLYFEDAPVYFNHENSMVVNIYPGAYRIFKVEEDGQILVRSQGNHDDTYTKQIP